MKPRTLEHLACNSLILATTFASLTIAGFFPSSLLGQVSEKRSSTKTYPSLEFRKWSGKINVPDPVSVSVDNQGRVYATQTKRRKIQDLDIREHSQWIPSDVALSSVEEKREFLKRELAIGGDQDRQRRHVQDLNGDGQHDWRDLQVVSEVIYQLTDTNSDGTADQMTVFAEDFKTEVTGIAAGVLAYDGSVWATIAPDVWKLTDTDNDGQADIREVMAHGFGMHIAYAGHDMHGLTVGPDGKIYWSIGDKGINVTTPEGIHWFYPNRGGVLRCNPDGSDFEVFAHGLRNVQELAFDQYGNLFSVDNDADQPNEKERFVYIVNAMDAGWRCNYQYRNGEYNPWTDEKLWEMPGKDHPAYIVPPLGHYVDGPAGFVYNPGTALVPEYYDFFFLTSAPNGQQYAFRAEPTGDAFRMVDQHQIGSGIAIVGWNWGPDGALYGADWDGGYPLDEKGSVVRMDAQGVNQEIRDEVRQLLNTGLQAHPVDQLKTLLAHQDQRIRLAAQFELVARNQVEILQQVVADQAAELLARIHAVWGLGQLSRAGVKSAGPSITVAFQDQDYHLRGQAAKTFGESRDVDSALLLPLLDDSDLYVRTLAANALARHPIPDAVPALLKQAATIQEDQHYLRHSHSWALSQCASAQQLAETTNRSGNLMQRMCCLLALRHQNSPLIAGYLADPSDWVATEAARAIHDDFSIAGALPELATALTQQTQQTEAFTRRAINANFRIGTADAARRVAEFASDHTRSLPMRLEAIDALRDWSRNEALDRVDGRNRHLPARQLQPAWIADQLAAVIASPDTALRTAALLAAGELRIDVPDQTLVQLVNDRRLEDALRAAALKTLTSRDSSSDLQSLANQALEGQGLQLRQQAIVTLCYVAPSAGISAAEKLIDDSEAPLPLRQLCIAVLEKLPGAEVLLGRLLEDFEQAKLDSSLSLDLLQTVQRDERLGLPNNVDWFSLARDGGDAAKGARLFRNHPQAQCSRCHRVGRNGSNIGPELSQIGVKRDADYLLRAILDPSADIDEKYRTQLYLLESGRLLKGVFLRENEDVTVIADGEGKEIEIPNEEILETKVQTVSLMPPMTEVLTPAEVRDLVAYLKSLDGK